MPLCWRRCEIIKITFSKTGFKNGKEEYRYLVVKVVGKDQDEYEVIEKGNVKCGGKGWWMALIKALSSEDREILTKI